MSELAAISTLFGEQRFMKPQGKVESERSTLIRWFAEQTGKDPKVIAIRLSRYHISELYYMQSTYKDRLNRDGKETADRHFWWNTKTVREGKEL